MAETHAALPAPAGATVDLDNTHNPLRPTYTASLVLIMLFPALAVPMRFYTKIFIIKMYKATDLFCLIGFLNFIALITLGFVFMNVGMGKQAYELPQDSYSRLAELLNIQQAVYMPAILFTKVAILLQLLEIFSPAQVSKRFRYYSLWTLIGLNTIFFTTLMFVEIFQCLPRQKIWNHSLHGKCLNINQTFVASGVINVVDDWVILTLPLIWTFQLNLRLKQKIGVSLIFATGGFAFITSVMRLVESIRSLNDPNISISLLPVSLWAAAEVSAGLVVCCLPLFPRLFSNNNARAILHSSEPSQEFTGLSSKITAGAHVTEYDDSSETSIQSQRNNFVVMKSVTLDQTSTYV